MSEYIDRFDRFGRSIANDIYHGVERGNIKIIAKEVSDGRRLDHYAQEYYGNGLNWWIIAAASGVRWHLGIGTGSGNRDTQESTVLFIPDLDDVKRLKNR